MKLPKQFIVNVIYTVIGDSFADWVKERVVARNIKIVKVQNLAIDMDPEVYAAFTNSTAVSSKFLSIYLSIFFNEHILTIFFVHVASKGVGANQSMQGGQQETSHTSGDSRRQRGVKAQGGRKSG